MLGRVSVREGVVLIKEGVVLRRFCVGETSC